MLSPQIQTHLEAARLAENTYLPSDVIASQLQNKALVMLVGPVAIGKSSLVSEVTKHSNKIAKVVDIVTRPMRESDEPGLYDYVPHTDAGVTKLLEMIKNRQLVQYAVHPTTGYIYATRLQDFPAEYNVLATLSSVVEGLKMLPFKETLTVGIVADADSWRQRLMERFSEKSEERTKRLNEAVQSIEWQLSQNENDIFWLENSQDKLEEAAANLVEIVLNKKHFDKRELAEEMLKTAKELL